MVWPANFSLIKALAQTLQAYRIPKHKFTAVPEKTTTHALPGTVSAMSAPPYLGTDNQKEKRPTVNINLPNAA
jgi:hypothetical protein